MSSTISVDGVGPRVAFTADVIRDQAALDALAGEWAALYRQIPEVSPFQAHAWVAAWARAYCRPGRLRIVVIRNDEGLVAIAPLYVSRRFPVPVLSTMGGEITDYHDFLIHPDDDRAGQALTQALLAQGGWRVLDLPEVRPDAAVVPWIEAWTGPVTQFEGDTSLELPAQPLLSLLAGIPGPAASKIRRQVRKAEAAGLRISRVAPEDAAQAVPRMLALHEEQWRGRGINPEHLTRRFRAHLTEAVSGMVAAGEGAITEFHLDGELMLSQFALVGNRYVGGYLAGISPDLRRRIDVATMQFQADLQLSVDSGVPRFSMLRGTEGYKGKFRPDSVTCRRVLLSRPGALGGVGFPVAAKARAAAYDWGRERVPKLRGVRRWWIRARTPPAQE